MNNSNIHFIINMYYTCRTLSLIEQQSGWAKEPVPLFQWYSSLTGLGNLSNCFICQWMAALGKPRVVHLVVLSLVLLWYWAPFCSIQWHQCHLICLLVGVLHPGSSYGYWLGTVHTHCDFIALPHWETRPSAPWSIFPLSKIILTELTSPCLILVMLNARLSSDK